MHTRARLGSWTTVAAACGALCAAPIAVLGVTAGSTPAGAATTTTTTLPPTLSLSATSLSFPETTLGDVRFIDYTMTNTSKTTDTVTIPVAPTAGANPNDFSQVPGSACTVSSSTATTYVVSLAASAKCSITVGFNPGALGTRSATLTLADTAKTNPSVTVTGTGGIGYYQVASNGAVAAFGDAALFGDASKTPLTHPIVGVAQTGDDAGYWLVASDGGVFAYGDAGFHGSTGAIHLNKQIVGMAPTVTSAGYWLVASDGGVFAYGDAHFYGSTGSYFLNKPIVGMASTVNGGGYWLVAADGGVFSFGNARFYGSTGAMHLNQPIVAMASTPDGGGYWLVAADGGVFSFGDARFFGSTGALHLNQPIVGTAPMPTGNGYWFTASDGGLFSFGDAPFLGAAATKPIGSVVGMATDGAPTAQAVLHIPADRQSVVAHVRDGSTVWAGLHVEH